MVCAVPGGREQVMADKVTAPLGPRRAIATNLKRLREESVLEAAREAVSRERPDRDAPPAADAAQRRFQDPGRIQSDPFADRWRA